VTQQRPPLLPDDPPAGKSASDTQPKRAPTIPAPPPPPRQRPPVRPTSSPPPAQSSGARRGLFIVLLMLAVLLSLGLAALTYLVFDRPQTLGLARVGDLRQTDAAISGTLSALEATDAAIGGLATQVQGQFQNLSATQAALQNQQAQLIATLTQRAVQDIATLTSIAQNNQQQATQSALNMAATQTAIASLAAQAQQNFQATQTALAANLPTPQPTASPNIVLIDSGFENLSESAGWDGLPPNTAWAQQGADSLVAQVNAATLLTRGASSSAYTVTTNLSAPAESLIDVLLSVDRNTGGLSYGVRLTVQGGLITRARFFVFDAVALNDPNGLTLNDTQVLADRSGLGILAERVTVEAIVSGGTTNVMIGGQAIFALTGSPPANSVGIQAAAGTRIFRLSVR